MQFVITTTEPIENLNEVATQVLDKARASGMFWFIDADLKLDKPQSTLTVDRDLVADLGLTQQNVGGALGAALGGGYVNYFSLAGRSYKVIPQVLQVDRLNPDQVLDYYVHSGDGSLIPARTVASLKTSVVPETISHFQQLKSATIGGVPGVAEADALKFLRDTLKAGSADRLQRRLLGAIATVHPGIRQLCHDTVLRAADRLPGARRTVRELPRSGRYSGVGADGAVRRADLHQPRGPRTYTQHLYRGGARDAPRPRQ